MLEVAIWRDRDGFRGFPRYVSQTLSNKSIKINTQTLLLPLSSSSFLFAQIILVNSSRRNGKSALSMPIWNSFSTHTELRNLVKWSGLFWLMTDLRWTSNDTQNLFKALNTCEGDDEEREENQPEFMALKWNSWDNVVNIESDNTKMLIDEYFN